MSLWCKVRELQDGEALRQIQQLYDANFPIEFRHFFAEIIEKQIWDNLDPDNPNHTEPAAQILDTFLKEITQHGDMLRDGGDFLQRLRFQDMANNFHTVYANAPLELVRTAKRILETEKRLVEHQANLLAERTSATLGDSQQQRNNLNEKHGEIERELERMANITHESGQAVDQLNQKQELFVVHYQETVKIDQQMEQIFRLPQGDAQRVELEKTEIPKLQKLKQDVDQVLKTEATNLMNLRTKLAQKHSEQFGQLSQLHSVILEDELICWKRAQALAYNGIIQDRSLDQLQRWCEKLAEIIVASRNQIKRVENMRKQLPMTHNPDLLPDLNNTITTLLSTLVTSTFIIEKQPPQVLKTQTRFSTTIRLLVGGKLNVHMTPPTVEANIISEQQAKELLHNKAQGGAGGNSMRDRSGEILNNKCLMEYHPQSGVLSVNFRNMSLKRIKRSDKRGAESVTEEKFTILFKSQFSIGGNELVFHVRTLSLPVVVIVHGNQEANASASILWDNAFSEQGRIPFQVPDKVVWCKIVDTLNFKWKHECQSNFGLSGTAMMYLAQKLFRQPVGAQSDRLVTWAQFNRETLQNRSFTFWQWFNGVMDCCRSKHVIQHWNDRAIIGFIGKNESQEKLLQKPNGTFLLRFSDSEIGGITIAWVYETDAGIRQVWNLQPHTPKDMTIRSLADRVRDLEHLHYVVTYDDRIVTKDEVFAKYYSKTQQLPDTPSDGYVKAQIQVCIPKINNMSLNDTMSNISGDHINSPNTPGGVSVGSGGGGVGNSGVGSPFRMGDGNGSSLVQAAQAAAMAAAQAAGNHISPGVAHEQMASPHSSTSGGLPTFPETSQADVASVLNNINAKTEHHPPPSVQSGTSVQSDSMTDHHNNNAPQPGFSQIIMDDFNSSPIDVNELLSKQLN